jgi:hypothetical protein
VLLKAPRLAKYVRANSPTQILRRNVIPDTVSSTCLVNELADLPTLAAIVFTV